MTLRYEPTSRAAWSNLWLADAYVGDVLQFANETGVRLFYRTRLSNGDIGPMSKDFADRAALETFLGAA